MAHAGSWNWYGVQLPDFGITEKIQSVISPNSSLSQQGGSNLIGGSKVVSSNTNTGVNTGVLQGPVYNGPQLSSSSSPLQSNTVNPVSNDVPIDQGISVPSYEDQMRSSINSGWDSYIGQLNSLLNVDLPRYQTEQQGIAQNSAQLATQNAGIQKGSSERAVQEQQKSSLKDLGDNVKNLFQSGNIYLGSRGAGDSSAANQYSYAITKMGSKARGDIMSQASSRLNQIKDIYDTEVNRIGSELNNRMGQIADWFYSQQSALKQSLGNAGLNREKDLQALSTNLYNQALVQLQNIQAEAQSRRQALESWAMSNSRSTQELVANLQNVQQMPAFSGIQAGMPSVDSQGNYQLPVGAGYFGGSTDEKKTGLFG